VSGPKTGTACVHILRAPRAHKTFSATRFRSQAFAVWQRCNHVLSHIPPEKEPVLLNLDETSVALHHGDQKGNVIAMCLRSIPMQTKSML